MSFLKGLLESELGDGNGPHFCAGWPFSAGVAVGVSSCSDSLSDDSESDSFNSTLSSVAGSLTFCVSALVDGCGEGRRGDGACSLLCLGDWHGLDLPRSCFRLSLMGTNC